MSIYRRPSPRKRPSTARPLVAQNHSCSEYCVCRHIDRTTQAMWWILKSLKLSQHRQVWLNRTSEISAQLHLSNRSRQEESIASKRASLHMVLDHRATFLQSKARWSRCQCSRRWTIRIMAPSLHSIRKKVKILQTHMWLEVTSLLKRLARLENSSVNKSKLELSSFLLKLPKNSRLFSRAHSSKRKERAEIITSE